VDNPPRSKRRGIGSSALVINCDVTLCLLEVLHR
jgi:hypothetical protein